jgi:hypothetical protein
MQEIGKRLKLPDKMIEQCILNLHSNGIFILKPLKTYNNQEWFDLKLPIAVSKELKDALRTEGTS